MCKTCTQTKSIVYLYQHNALINTSNINDMTTLKHIELNKDNTVDSNTADSFFALLLEDCEKAAEKA